MADPKLEALVICGSLRKRSYNAALARALPALAPPDLTLTAAPPYDTIPHYNHDIQDDTGFPEPVMTLANAIRAADGLIIVSPEYNWSIPGPLKNAIDWMSRLPDQPFKDKPVAIQSASPALLGGSRMQYHLRQSLASIEAMVFVKPEIIVTFAQNKIDVEKSAIIDDATRDIVRQQLAAFSKFVRRWGKGS